MDISYWIQKKRNNLMSSKFQFFKGKMLDGLTKLIAKVCLSKLGGTFERNCNLAQAHASKKGSWYFKFKEKNHFQATLDAGFLN